VNKQEEARHMALATLAAPPPAEHLASPLDYIFAEHFRQRTLCWMIDRIADERERDEECISAVLRFLREDFGAHIIDEEEDLFPLLRRRA
jgi:iron-sulfur cluster repair protein YtfE (RIC family)